MEPYDFHCTVISFMILFLKKGNTHKQDSMKVNRKNNRPVSHIHTYTGCFFTVPMELTKLIMNNSQPAMSGKENQGLNSQYSRPPNMPMIQDMRMPIMVVIKMMNCAFTSMGKRNGLIHPNFSSMISLSMEVTVRPTQRNRCSITPI